MVLNLFYQYFINNSNMLSSRIFTFVCLLIVYTMYNISNLFHVFNQDPTAQIDQLVRKIKIISS